METTQFCGVIFDLDGVITQTQKIHSAAWEKMFNDFLKTYCYENNLTFEAFDRRNDYLLYVDGKPRIEGIRSFLKSRSIELPEGNEQDDIDQKTIWGLGNKKNQDFRHIIQTQSVEIYQSTISLIEELKKKRIKVGVASSSKNCHFILEQSKLLHYFETVVDGEVSQKLHLKGKPEPDIFAKAAENMGLFPHQCVIVEDAISGVKAGLAGNFGMVLGVARSVDGRELLANGADTVVSDLSEINYQDMHHWFEKGINYYSWRLKYYGFHPAEEKLRETLFTTGNGYFGTRGCIETEKDDGIHYPGCYIAGVYNKTPSMVHHKKIFNNDLVNCPNWLPIEFKIGKSDYISPFQMEILSYKQILNMKKGLIERSGIFKHKTGKITRIKIKRFSSMENPHLAAIRFEIIPLNYADPITVRTYLDGSVINNGVERYRQLNQKHLKFISSGKEKDYVYLCMQTT
ncbi:MAG: beta-phosphoglucomutase family hydrolase, partial [Spirochaetes bacterium]|nr:beta-phosphoglucomutase family hydrolase [Spirochaetota bacterium]